MSHLLDTNVVSEWAKPQPDPNVVAWLRAQANRRLVLSVVTFGEIRRGIESLPVSRRRADLETWLNDELATWFEGRILLIDRQVPESWGASSREEGD